MRPQTEATGAYLFLHIFKCASTEAHSPAICGRIPAEAGIMTTDSFFGRIIILSALFFLRCGNASPNRSYWRATRSVIYLLYLIADAHGSAICGRTPEEAGSYHSYQLSSIFIEIFRIPDHCSFSNAYKEKNIIILYLPSIFRDTYKAVYFEIHREK